MVIENGQSLNVCFLHVVLVLSSILIATSVPEVGEVFVLYHYLCSFIALAVCMCSVMCHREPRVNGHLWNMQLEEYVYAVGCYRQHHVQ